MTRQLVYDVDTLAELPVGTAVQAHRTVSGTKGEVQIVVRQPDGWFGAWEWEHPIDPGLVIPCTVLFLASVRPTPAGAQ